MIVNQTVIKDIQNLIDQSKLSAPDFCQICERKGLESWKSIESRVLKNN